MIPERYRPLETHTLMDLVTYGDSDYDEPGTEDWHDGEEEPAPRRRVPERGRRSWSSVRRKGETWLRRGRLLIARSRAR